MKQPYKQYLNYEVSQLFPEYSEDRSWRGC